MMRGNSAVPSIEELDVRIQLSVSFSFWSLAMGGTFQPQQWVDESFPTTTPLGADANLPQRYPVNPNSGIPDEHPSQSQGETPDSFGSGSWAFGVASGNILQKWMNIPSSWPDAGGPPNSNVPIDTSQTPPVDVAGPPESPPSIAPVDRAEVDPFVHGTTPSSGISIDEALPTVPATSVPGNPTDSKWPATTPSSTVDEASDLPSELGWWWVTQVRTTAAVGELTATPAAVDAVFGDSFAYREPDVEGSSFSTNEQEVVETSVILGSASTVGGADASCDVPVEESSAAQSSPTSVGNSETPVPTPNDGEAVASTADSEPNAVQASPNCENWHEEVDEASLPSLADVVTRVMESESFAFDFDWDTWTADPMLGERFSAWMPWLQGLSIALTSAILVSRADQRRGLASVLSRRTTPDRADEVLLAMGLNER